MRHLVTDLPTAGRRAFFGGGALVGVERLREALEIVDVELRLLEELSKKEEAAKAAARAVRTALEQHEAQAEALSRAGAAKRTSEAEAKARKRATEEAEAAAQAEAERLASRSAEEIEAEDALASAMKVTDARDETSPRQKRRDRPDEDPHPGSCERL